MAQKAIVYGVTVGDNGAGAVLVTAMLQAIDDTDAPVAEPATSSVFAVFTDSFDDIKTKLVTAIQTSFSDSEMEVIFWDDIGQLRP
jgi:hypothetical protein